MNLQEICSKLKSFGDLEFNEGQVYCMHLTISDEDRILGTYVTKLEENRYEECLQRLVNKVDIDYGELDGTEEAIMPYLFDKVQEIGLKYLVGIQPFSDDSTGAWNISGYELNSEDLYIG